MLIEKWINFPSVSGWTLTKLSNNAWRFHDSSLFFDSQPLTIDTGVWHQVIARRDGNAFSIFFDNTEVASASFVSPIADTSAPLLIGRRGDARGFATNGRIDEVAIWNQALSDTEISLLWNNGAGRQADNFATSIPEPPTPLLFSTGVLGLLSYRWRQRKERG